MQLLRHLAIALVVGIATYSILVFTALLAAGRAVSCTNNCTDMVQFLNDAYPRPMIGGIAVAAATAALTLRRVRHRPVLERRLPPVGPKWYCWSGRACEVRR